MEEYINCVFCWSNIEKTPDEMCDKCRENSLKFKGRVCVTQSEMKEEEGDEYDAEEGTCLVCWMKVSSSDSEGSIPALDDDKEWEKIQAQHYFECSWARTRAFCRAPSAGGYGCTDLENMITTNCCDTQITSEFHDLDRVPAPWDDESWRRMGKYHAPWCEWIKTRAYRV